MLILRRRPGEAVWIGENVKVTILTADDGGVRLAIEAPKEIPILREELLSAMEANQDAGASAAAGATGDLLEALVKLEGAKEQSATEASLKANSEAKADGE